MNEMVLSKDQKSHLLEATPKVNSSIKMEMELNKINDENDLYNKEEIRITFLDDGCTIKVDYTITHVKMIFVSYFFNRPFSTFSQAFRVYEITGVEFNGSNAHSIREKIVEKELGEWIIDGLELGRIYCVEFGIKLSTHKFFPLLRSNFIETPPIGNKLEEKPQKNNLFKKHKGVTTPKWAENVSSYTFYANHGNGWD